jgi:hypothetical protein
MTAMSFLDLDEAFRRKKKTVLIIGAVLVVLLGGALLIGQAGGPGGAKTPSPSAVAVRTTPPVTTSNLVTDAGRHTYIHTNRHCPPNLYSSPTIHADTAAIPNSNATDAIPFPDTSTTHPDASSFSDYSIAYADVDGHTILSSFAGHHQSR